MLYLIGLHLWLSWERICLQSMSPRFDSWVRKIRWRRERLPTPVFLGFPGGSAGKESACDVGDLGSIPGLGRSPAEGKGYPLQYSCLENLMDGGVWRATVHGVTRVRHDLATKPQPHSKHVSLGPCFRLLLLLLSRFCFVCLYGHARFHLNRDFLG